MSASGRTGRKGIESDFRFWPMAEATAARHGRPVSREHLPRVGGMTLDICDNLTHTFVPIEGGPVAPITKLGGGL
jgi:hypothetical protein